MSASPSPFTNSSDATGAERPPRLGAVPTSGGVEFHLWAPEAERVELLLEGGAGTDTPQQLPMEPVREGYFRRFAPRMQPGHRYRYRLDGEGPYPDPASRFQPEGVHGPSQVIDPDGYGWRDEDWTGIPQEELVFYELHVGTFTPEGSFAATEAKLDYLRELGVTAIELMPVADFPGRWNWGYDPAALYAPSRAYGTPEALRSFVDAAHRAGLAVFLDVIYNHLGPDGAYFPVYGPVFTDRHETPWGRALNMDGPGSEGVRGFFLDNALHWLEEYHLDGLRLDATFEIHDDSETHFLTELRRTVEEVVPAPERTLVAEDPRDLNTLLLPRKEDGYELDAVWVDDFHHQVRNLTAGDEQGYFASYRETRAADLAETIDQGWYFTGGTDPATGEPRGSDPTPVAQTQCVYCIQNHDQVGNRPTGNRLTDDVDLPTYRAASALLLFVSELPLLFMGQEWAASTPFRYFTDHEPELGRKVTEGRTEEFAHWTWFDGEVPDPQDPETFASSRLDWSEPEKAPHAGIVHMYRDLLTLRSELSGPSEAEPIGPASLLVRRDEHLLLVHLGAPTEIALPEDAGPLLWKSLDSDYAAGETSVTLENGTASFPAAGALIFTRTSA